MSLKIDLDLINDDIREKINDELKIEIESNSNIFPNKVIQPFDLINNDIYLPFAFAIQELELKRPLRNEYPQIKLIFEGVLRPEQKVVKEEAISFLTKTGSIIVSAYPGFGKTLLAINLSSSIKLKTLIIVNKIVLIKQWEESILKFCPTASIQKLTAKSKMKDCDFYIMNAINVEKMGKNFFKDIGNLIVDEAHLIMAETLVKSLKFICPRYLIGLSATPYRNDGLNLMLDFYFGTNKIIREMNREHIVYMVNTGFVPTVEKMENGKLNWGLVLQSQSEDEDRNILIINIIKKFEDRSILVLTKRVEQGKFLMNKLKELDEDVTSLLGDQQDYNRESRILVGTTSKCGTGFDHPKLDTLILAADIDAYFIQVLGRIFRRKDTVPIVFDLVDNNGVLIKHFKNRKEVYNKIGGKIVSFNKKFPEFFSV
jgi:superfamily II DNA or RNA helicase